MTCPRVGTWWSQDLDSVHSVPGACDLSLMTLPHSPTSFFLAVQGTLKSLFGHHGSKASVLWCSAFFMIQPSLPLLSYKVEIEKLYINFGIDV